MVQFFAGLFIGSMVGVITMCFTFIAGRSDDYGDQ